MKCCGLFINYDSMKKIICILFFINVCCLNLASQSFVDSVEISAIKSSYKMKETIVFDFLNNGKTEACVSLSLKEYYHGRWVSYIPDVVGFLKGLKFNEDIKQGCLALELPSMKKITYKLPVNKKLFKRNRSYKFILTFTNNEIHSSTETIYKKIVVR